MLQAMTPEQFKERIAHRVLQVREVQEEPKTEHDLADVETKLDAIARMAGM